MMAPQDPTRVKPEPPPSAAVGARGGDTPWELTLFVSGASDLSASAIIQARQLCDTHLAGRYHLSIVDVHEDPAAALASGVLVAPTLVKNQPLPLRRHVGDLSHAAKVLPALEIPYVKDALPYVKDE